MRQAANWARRISCVILLLGGCSLEANIADGSTDAGHGAGDGATPGADADAGGLFADGGTSIGNCPPNTATPGLCRVCVDGSCGERVCGSSGWTNSWKCPEDDPPADCDCGRESYIPVCGSDGQSYDATCGRHCVPVPIACDGECPCRADAGAGLQWYLSCGDPVCGISPEPSDNPNIPNCTTEDVGEACGSEGARCDGVANCGAHLICAATDPTNQPGGCPISRARFKEEISYLSEQELHGYHEQLMSLPLASYRYRHAQGAGPQLGFIIEDIEPSVAVSGDHVNMYGYLSMAVAAIKVQQEQITALQRELKQLRAQTAAKVRSAGGRGR